jgi:hypothetical protein
MEGDDNLVRPLGEQDALLLAHCFRTNETTNVISGGSALNLANEAWSHGSAKIVRRDRMFILYALVGIRTIRSVDLGYHFLTSIGSTLPNEDDSTIHLSTTLHAIGSLPSLCQFTLVGLPGLPETINTRVLLQSMATFENDLETLEFANIEFRSNAEVQLLADLMASHGGALTKLYLRGLINVINDDMAGLLDPILLAMTSSSGASYLLPSYFELSGGDGVSVSGVSLIGEAALGRFLLCGGIRCTLRVWASVTAMSTSLLSSCRLSSPGPCKGHQRPSRSICNQTRRLECLDMKRFWAC